MNPLLREPEIPDELLDALGNLATLLFWPALLFAPQYARSPQDEARTLHLRRTVWRLRRVLEEASGGDPSHYPELFASLAAVFREGSQEMVAWISLIETLVQETEKTYGRASGRGQYKLAQVKAATLHVLRNSNVDLPSIPGFIEPFILDAAVGWSSDLVVRLLNRFELWEDAPEQPPLRLRVSAPLLIGSGGLLRWISNALTGVAWRIVLMQNRLAPSVREALERQRPDLSNTARSMLLALQWLGEHGKDLRALIEVVGIATQEAEAFRDMRGPEKQAYARDLILVLLEEMGFYVPQSGLLRALVEAGTDVIIDATVAVFNKRGGFSQRQVALPLPVPAGAGERG